jgi:hypothetical protein
MDLPTVSRYLASKFLSFVDGEKVAPCCLINQPFPLPFILSTSSIDNNALSNLAYTYQHRSSVIFRLMPTLMYCGMASRKYGQCQNVCLPKCRGTKCFKKIRILFKKISPKFSLSLSLFDIVGNNRCCNNSLQFSRS